MGYNKPKNTYKGRYLTPATKTEGIQKYLVSKLPGYKRSQLFQVCKAFTESIGKEKKSSYAKVASDNFEKFKLFVKALKEEQERPE